MLDDNRIFYLDEIRALAILLVILCHVGQHFPTNIDTYMSFVPLAYMSIGRMGVPLFFMLSGALLINKDYTLSVFLKKRLSRVITPALFWIVISILVYSLYTPYTSYFFASWFDNCGFLWFIFAILGIYLVIPIFNSFIKEHGMKACEYFLLLWFVLLIFNYLNLLDLFYIKLLFNNVGVYIGYAVLGYYLTNKDFGVLSGPMVVFGIIMLAASIYSALYIAGTYLILVDYLSFVLIIECSSIFIIFRYIHRYSLYRTGKPLTRVHNYVKDSWIGSIIYVISKCSYSMYFLNSILVKYLSQTVAITSIDFLPVTFIVITLLTVIIIVIMSFIPYLNEIIGIK